MSVCTVLVELGSSGLTYLDVCEYPAFRIELIVAHPRPPLQHFPPLLSRAALSIGHDLHVLDWLCSSVVRQRKSPSLSSNNFFGKRSDTAPGRSMSTLTSTLPVSTMFRSTKMTCRLEFWVTPVSLCWLYPVLACRHRWLLLAV